MERYARKRSKPLFVITCAAVSLILVYSSWGEQESKSSNEVRPKECDYINPKQFYDCMKGVTLSRKHVTKSLSELGATPSTSEDVLFFNRVPKCGSEMLVLLITWLQGENNFRHYRLPGGRSQSSRKLNRLEQEQMVEDVKSMSRDTGLPTSYDRHVYFTNFSSFGSQNPIYINLIRDPVDKMVSRFYYADLKHRTRRGLFDECVAQGVREECTLQQGRPYDLAIPYFCGHEPFCAFLNDRWALERAKANVERYFSVVGVLEHLNETLAVLEHAVPNFFSGVYNLYFNELLQPRLNRNKSNPRDIQPETRDKLTSTLRTEYEFYHFIKSRLINQYAAIPNPVAN